MKYLKFLLLLLIPCVVSAKVNSIEVVNIEKIEKSDNVLVIEMGNSIFYNEIKKW